MPATDFRHRLMAMEFLEEAPLSREPATEKMPKFKTAPASVIAIFNDAIKNIPDAERRKMFGYPCAFVNGQMLCGVFADRIMLRLSEQDRSEFLMLPEARLFEPIPGRPMKEYVELPPQVMSSPEDFSSWLQRSLEYVRTLPPKEKKSRARK
jgi:TfoX/Sxy family transcriptional regulator of competence genes